VKIDCWPRENGDVHEYEISQITEEGYKPIANQKEFIEITNSSTFGPEIVKKAKKEVEILEILSERLCIIIEGSKKEINMFKDMAKHEEAENAEEKIEEMKRLGKETYYVKTLSDQLLKFSNKVIEDLWSYNKDLTDLRKEIREADELSIKLSNMIASAIDLPEYKIEPLSDKEVNEKIAKEVTKRIYKTLLYSFINGPYLDWRVLLRSLLEIEIYTSFDEKIIIQLPTVNERFGYKLGSELKRLILEPGSTKVEGVNIDWPAIYIDSGLDEKLVRIKVQYIER